MENGDISILCKGSELGNLYDGYSYYPGLVKLYIDAKGNATSTSYQAFDQPTEDAVTQINVSEGVSVKIARDIFGKTTSITRSGSGVSATRSYVYDGYERLCKTIEPETGATIQDYDTANNIAWRATGLGLTATNACNTSDVPASKQITYTYDARNRLRNTTYGDGSPAIYRTYTNDGLPNTIQSDGTLWTYGYNNRRLPTSETLNYGGVNYSIGRSYDANGSLSQLTYPDNFSVAYNPNALGEARQAGGYATAVYYHPNGAVKQFSYGNGIAHTLAQNLRGLPQLSQDGSVLKDSYAYDQNANVASITDQVEGVTTRNMEYDGLNRLTHVNASALWGDAWYGYDALDNLTSSQMTAGAKARTLTHNINYTNNRLDSVTGRYTLGYQYDNQGNIILRGGQSYSFDIGNRMRSAPGITTHAYDGLGRRTSVVGTDGVNHIYVYGQEGKLLYETTTGQALASGTKYVYLNRHVVAEVSGGGVVYDHTDGLGSPVAKTSSSAGLISRTRYEPYGATAAGTEPTIGFTGHLNAANLGLVDMQQRFYDPVAGRFLSTDPVTTDANSGASFNRFAYAVNDPYGFIDPDGRDEKPVDKEAERQQERLKKEQDRLCGTGQCEGISTVHSNGGGGTAGVAGSQQLTGYEPGGQYEMNIMGDFVNPDAPGVGVGQIILGGTVIAGAGVVIVGTAPEIGVLAATQAKRIRRNVKVDGPGAGLVYGNGRVFQIRYNGKPVFRLDYQPVQGSNNQSRLHFHIGDNMKIHYVIDPRGWFDK